jgi:hypothetical protein
MGGMKTQVIKLDLHDDVTSVRDKMSWTKTERILLVFPRRSHILERTLDLRLLQRHAVTLGAQLAIVSRSLQLRRAAEGLAIPVFMAPGSAQRRVWDEEKVPVPLRRRSGPPDLNRMRLDAFPPEALWRSLDNVRFGIFSLAVLAILAVLSLFIPSATIQLTPATQQQNLAFTIHSSLHVTAVNLAGSLPARLTSVIVEHNKSIQATGSVAIPDSPARGFVRFRNLTTDLVGIPTGTIVRTQATPTIRFYTTVDAVVAAGIDETVDVPVQAVEAGSTGNLPADTLVAFEVSDLGTSLAVTNPTMNSGGSDRPAAIQTAVDRLLVHEDLQAELLEECRTDLQQTLSPGDISFPDTLTISQVISEIYFPAEGQSGETLSLTMRLQCQIQYASFMDMNSLAEISLDANLLDGYTPVSESLTLLPESIPFTDLDGITSWEVEAERLIRAILDPWTVIKLSMGHKPSTAILRLNESLPLTESPVIQVEPEWWPWLPVVPLRMSVYVGER